MAPSRSHRPGLLMPPPTLEPSFDGNQRRGLQSSSGAMASARAPWRSGSAKRTWRYRRRPEYRRVSREASCAEVRFHGVQGRISQYLGLRYGASVQPSRCAGYSLERRRATEWILWLLFFVQTPTLPIVCSKKQRVALSWRVQDLVLPVEASAQNKRRRLLWRLLIRGHALAVNGVDSLLHLRPCEAGV